MQEHRVSNRRAVVVTGLLHRQARMIEREFEQLDIRFFGVDDSPASIRNGCAHVAAAICMVDFISHIHSKAMSDSAAVYIEISGGLTRLRDELKRQVLAC